MADRNSGAHLRWLAAWVAMSVCAGALGEVTLDTAVTKVETTLDAGGRVKRALMPAEEVVPGEELRYTITFTNTSEMVVDESRIVITNPIPRGVVYVIGSAGGDATLVEYSTDGEAFGTTEPAADPPAAGAPSPALPAAPPAGSGPAAEPGEASAVRSLRWTYRNNLAPGESGEVYFHVRMQ
jgi:uncharacterized repeat protein (TIGR01451 family)